MFNLSEEEILSLSKQHIFWTWSAQSKVNPIPVKHAEGVYFWDIKGKRYLDFNSMTMCVNVGHGNTKIIQAMKTQADELPYAAPGMATEVRALASKMVADITPGGKLSKILFTLGGADANENAIKLARGYTKKFKVLTRYRSYHGATAGAMALTGDPRRIVWEPGVMPGVVHFLDPYRYRSTFHRMNQDISEEDFCIDYLNHLEEIIQYEGQDTIAAILLESVTGTNGVIIPPDGYMEGVRRLCDKYHIVMIADEVMSGFGRTGKWFAIDHWNVIPDIITMAKGLTSAYAPLGAVAMKPEIAATYDVTPFEGGLTYTSHPVSLAAAIANVNVIKEEKLIEHAEAMGKILRGLLKGLGEEHPFVGEVRNIGLFGIIELVKDRKTREPLAPWNASNQTMIQFRRYCTDHGLFLYTHWHTVLIIPPLIISEQQLRDGFVILDEALHTIEAERT